ncbi:MAG: MFS transporter [Sphaerochaetaceae bacterium]|nr:MFS transporter [Sphaerochaetaceae bacterium]
MATEKIKPMLNEDDDVIVYIDPAKRAFVTIALLVGFFGVHFYMRAFSMCTSYIMANWNAGEYYSAGKALQTAIMVVATAVSTYLIPKWGIKKIMGGSLIIILLCDIGTLFAPSLGVFLACVMLQGIGNAGYVANMISLMNKIWPKSKRAMWLSTIGITQGLAAVIVPTLSGAMIDKAGWKSVYYLMMGIQALGFVIMMIVTPKDTTQKNYTPKQFDSVGTILFLIWVSACVLAMNFGNSWGWNSARILALLAATVIGLVAFIIFEYKKGSKAIFPVKLFKDNINCTLIFLQSFFSCAVCMGQFVFIIYYMQVVMKTGAAISAIPFTIFSIGTLVMPTVYAMYYKKTGHCKGLLILTMLLVTANCFLYGLLLKPTTSLALIYAISAIGGLGHASCVTICYNAAEEYLPKSRIADGNQVAYIAICIAGSVGLAVMQAIANAVAKGQRAAGVEALAASGKGYTTAMFVAGICGIIGVIASAALSARAKENGAEN